MVYRVYVEKKVGQTHEADSLLRETYHTSKSISIAFCL